MIIFVRLQCRGYAGASRGLLRRVEQLARRFINGTESLPGVSGRLVGVLGVAIRDIIELAGTFVVGYWFEATTSFASCEYLQHILRRAYILRAQLGDLVAEGLLQA